MKRRILVFLAAWTVLLAHGTQAQPIQLVTGSFPPYEYQEGGQVKGMVVEIITEAFRRSNQSVQITVAPWPRALRMAQEGIADGIFAAVKTPEREKILLYSEEALIPLVVSLFVRKDAPISYDGDLAKLSGYRFGIVNQFSNGALFDRAVEEGVLKNVEVTTNTDSNVKMLMAGRIDIMVIHRYNAFFFLRKNNALDQVAELRPEIDSSLSYLAFTRKRDLTNVGNSFDRALASMKDDGTYHRIIERYEQRYERSASMHDYQAPARLPPGLVIANEVKQSRAGMAAKCARSRTESRETYTHPPIRSTPCRAVQAIRPCRRWIAASPAGSS